MRQMTYAAAMVLIASAWACSPRDRQETASRVDSAAEDVRDAAREGADEVRDEANEARDYVYAERADFRRDVDLRLKGLDEEIAQLKRDTKRGVNEARDSALVRIRDLRAEVSRKLDRLATATESNWDEMKRDLNASLTALQDAVRRERPDAKPMGGTGPS